MPDNRPHLRYRLLAQSLDGEYIYAETSLQRDIDRILQREPPELFRIHIYCPAIPGIDRFINASQWREFQDRRREIIRHIRRQARDQLAAAKASQ